VAGPSGPGTIAIAPHGR